MNAQSDMICMLQHELEKIKGVATTQGRFNIMSYSYYNYMVPVII